MSQPKETEVATVLRAYAEKLASEKNTGAPDRMTVADGQGGITAAKATIPGDPGEAALKADLPADAPANTTGSEPAGAPDRMTVADGQGGITASPGTVPTDSGEAALKKDIPADGATRKSASRIDRIRAAVQTAAGIAPAAEKQATPAAAPAAPAAQEPLQFDNSTLAKIASLTLSTDEGIQFVHGLLEKQAGEEAALHQIREAVHAADAFDNNSQVKEAAFGGAMTNAETIHNDLAQAGITEEDADSIMKQASFHQSRMAELDHPMLKQAYAQGMDDAAMLAGADEAAGEEGVPAVDEALPMGGEELGEEEILTLLQEMIASGEISEEDVAAALAEEGGAEGALPEEALAGAEGAVPEEALAGV